LMLPENEEALERFDFDAIRARRAPDWSVEPPRLRAGAAGCHPAAATR
jgi:hypothetical protein